MELFQKFLNQVGRKYKEADKALGGWLPGGGVASPLSRAKQEGERRLAEQIKQKQQEYVGQPGRFAGQGPVLNAVRAVTQAGANPVGIALGDQATVQKVSNYYAQNPGLQNEFDLNTNMFLRYLSGTGAEGLKVSPDVGRQIYADVKQQEKQFSSPQYREDLLRNPANPAYMKENLLAGKTPVYYGGSSEAIAPHNALLPTDTGQRWQLDKSLGSYWAEPTDTGYAITNERYNFGYAPTKKEGVKGASTVRMLPGSIADIGRNLVKQGFGNPFTYGLTVDSSGNVRVLP
jgi:hypothetical protein